MNWRERAFYLFLIVAFVSLLGAAIVSIIEEIA